MRKCLPYILLVLLLVLIAYGQTIFMYFWQDDSALIFKLQHPVERSGSFGPGLFDRGPYRYLVVPFVPFYPIFKLEPLGYFFVGFITYLLVLLAFYWMVRSVLKQRESYMATLVCAAGYIGSDTMFRVINSWQTNFGIAFGLVVLGTYIRFRKSLNSKLYFASILLYLCAIELIFIRSHALIASLIAVEIGFILVEKVNVRGILKSLVRVIPFLLLFGQWYLKDASFGAPGINSLFTQIFTKGELTLVAPFFSTLGNLFVPDTVLQKIVSATPRAPFLLKFLIVSITVGLTTIAYLANRISKKTGIVLLLSSLVSLLIIGSLYEQGTYYFRDNVSYISALVGAHALLWSILLFLSSKNKYLKITVVIGVITALSQIGSYYIQYPTFIFSTAHRYLSYAFIGYCLLYAGLFAVISSKRAQKIILVLGIIPMLILGWRYQSRILITRSLPSQNFYTSLLNFVPHINKGSIMYFDIDQTPEVGREFGDFFSVGSMPETTALAIYYGIDRYDVTMVTSFDELLSLISQRSNPLTDVYSFRYEKNNLIDITNEIKDQLTTELASEPFTNDIKYPARGYVLGRVTLSTSKTPFIMQKNSGLRFNEVLSLANEINEINAYYTNTKISSSTEWRYREIENILDKNTLTPWQGHRVSWYNNKQEDIVIDLGRVGSVETIRWNNWKASLTPTEYEYFASTDTVNWDSIGKFVIEEKLDGQLIEDVVSRTTARYIKMHITKTLTDDSPAITEIIVLPVSGQLLLTTVTEATVFDYASNINETNQIWKTYNDTAKVEVVTKRERPFETEYVPSLQTIADGNPRTYEFILPPGGVSITNLEIKSDFPVVNTIHNITLRNITLNELIERKLIKRLSEN